MPWSPFDEEGVTEVTSPPPGGGGGAQVSTGWSPFNEPGVSEIAAPPPRQTQAVGTPAAAGTPETDKAMSDVDRMFNNLQPVKAPVSVWDRLGPYIRSTEEYRKKLSILPPNLGTNLRGMFPALPRPTNAPPFRFHPRSADQMESDEAREYNEAAKETPRQVIPQAGATGTILAPGSGEPPMPRAINAPNVLQLPDQGEPTPPPFERSTVGPGAARFTTADVPPMLARPVEAPPTPDTGRVASMVGGGLRGVGPAAAFIAGARPGAYAVGRLGAMVPGPPQVKAVGMIVGAGIGAMITGGLAAKAAIKGQRYVAGKVSPHGIFAEETETAQYKAHPFLTQLGGAAAFGAPQPINMVKAGYTLATNEGRMALANLANQNFKALTPEAHAAAENVINVVQAGGLNVAMNIKDQIESGNYSFGELLGAAATGALFSKPWAFHPNPGAAAAARVMRAHGVEVNNVPAFLRRPAETLTKDTAVIKPTEQGGETHAAKERDITESGESKYQRVPQRPDVPENITGEGAVGSEQAGDRSRPGSAEAESLSPYFVHEMGDGFVITDSRLEDTHPDHIVEYSTDEVRINNRLNELNEQWQYEQTSGNVAQPTPAQAKMISQWDEALKAGQITKDEHATGVKSIMSPEEEPISLREFLSQRKEPAPSKADDLEQILQTGTLEELHNFAGTYKGPLPLRLTQRITQLETQAEAPRAKTKEDPKLKELKAQTADLRNEAAKILRRRKVIPMGESRQAREARRKIAKDHDDVLTRLWNTWDQIHQIRRESGKPREFVIIGGGAGGLKAAGHAAYEGIDTVVLERESTTGGQAKRSMEIVNTGATGEGSTGRDYFRPRYLTARNRGAEIRTGVEVVNLRPRADGGVDVITKSHGVIPAKRAAILTGSSIVEFPGFEHSGWGNAERLEMLSNGKVGMSNGGGNSASQAILSSIREGAKKIIALSRSKFGHDVSNDQMVRLRAYEKEGKVEFIQGTVKKVIPDHKTGGVIVRVAKTGGPKSEPTGEVVDIPVAHLENFLTTSFNTGWIPEGVAKVPIFDRRGKPVPGPVKVRDASLKTSMPGVYAGGDMRESLPGEEKVRRIDVAEGDAAGIAARVTKEILLARKNNDKLPEWNATQAEIESLDQELKALRSEEEGESTQATPISTPSTGGQTTPSLTTNEPTSRPTSKPSSEKTTPSPPSDTLFYRHDPGTPPPGASAVERGRYANMGGDVESPDHPDFAGTAPKPSADYEQRGPRAVSKVELTEPAEQPPPRPKTETEKEQNPNVRLTEPQMVQTIDKVFGDMHENGLTSERTPGDGLSHRGVLAGGRAAIRAGVRPETIANSRRIASDQKYAVLRAHGEDLKIAANAADNLARKVPSGANKDAAERAFRRYSEWDRNVVAPARENAFREFRNMQHEEFNPRTYTELRQQFWRINKRDPLPKERVKLETNLREITKSQKARDQAMNDYGEQLRKAAPDAENIKNNRGFFDYVAKILKEKFPCNP